MKLSLCLSFVALSALAAAPAMADPPAPQSTPGVYVAPEMTVHGRPNKPMVAIVIRTPTAAEAAGAAHDRLRLESLGRSQPPALAAH